MSQSQQKRNASLARQLTDVQHQRDVYGVRIGELELALSGADQRIERLEALYRAERMRDVPQKFAAPYHAETEARIEAAKGQP